MLELNDVLQASERIRPYIVHTPLLRTPALDELIGCQVYIKPEMFQLTGSFKVRGASSRMTLLTQQERERGGGYRFFRQSCQSYGLYGEENGDQGHCSDAGEPQSRKAGRNP